MLRRLLWICLPLGGDIIQEKNNTKKKHENPLRVRKVARQLAERHSKKKPVQSHAVLLVYICTLLYYEFKKWKPLFLGQKLPKKAKKLEVTDYSITRCGFSHFFLVSILYIKFWAVCCFVLPSEWVKSISMYNSKPLSLFVHNNVKCTYLQSSALLFFLGEIGFTWRLLQKISSYWYRKSWIGKPLPLCIVVPSLPKALLLLLGRFLLLMLLLPFLVKKNMIMQYL